MNKWWICHPTIAFEKIRSKAIEVAKANSPAVPALYYLNCAHNEEDDSVDIWRVSYCP